LLLGVAALALLAGSASLQNAVADGDTETLSFHHIHTGEDITITFKRDGHYDEAALKKLDWFMRDWRKEKETNMDPQLFDLLWHVYREVGGKEPIQIVCGFRSPGTNAMLRRRSSGVARFSQHINGKAIDFFIPGVPLAKVRAVGLQLQRGGVGFYPTSGSPFVHMDTASVRHWPAISRQQLVKIFPDGRTVHIPADGKPLRNYALALADIERRGNVPNGRSLEAARAAGAISEHDEQVAELVAEHEQQQQQHRSLFAKLFGSKQVADANSGQPAGETIAKPASAPMVVASLTPPPNPVHQAVPMPTARPKTVEFAAKPKPTIRPMQTAANDLIEKRGYWPGAPADGQMLPQSIAAEIKFETASLDDQILTGSTGGTALAYAAVSQRPAPRRVRPMGSRLPRLPVEARVMPVSASATAVVKAPLASAMTSGGQRANSPWLRAAMLTPSVTNVMTATPLGTPDMLLLHTLMYKPESSLLMSFSADPQLGMVTDRFSGPAVVFLATTTFIAQTISLR